MVDTFIETMAWEKPCWRCDVNRRIEVNRGHLLRYFGRVAKAPRVVEYCPTCRAALAPLDFVREDLTRRWATV